jgi:hypothetical protein
LPREHGALIPFALELMAEPFELKSKGAERVRRALWQSFTDLV